jgi:uncharacterized protein YhbP (UPF0306 family)
MSLGPEFKQSIRVILDESTTMTLATSEPDGQPRATPVMFAHDQALHLFFVSDPTTQHIRNLAQDGRAAAGIYPAVTAWRQIRGLQLKGRAYPVPSHARERAMRQYADRFPFIEELEDAVDTAELYQFVPSWIRLIDNRRGFGFSREADLS